MTARKISSTLYRPVYAGRGGAEAFDEALAAPATAVAAAHDHIAASALRDGSADAPRCVGLELEFHVVDLRQPGRRPQWHEVQQLLAELPELPSRSSVTVEPGGQLELSTPPGVGVAAAAAALRADREVFAAALREAGFGAAPLGADIARPVRRVHPGSRYRAMAAHFDALRCGDSGLAMMCATAALQVNLDAGPAAGWSQRIRHIRFLGPVLVAISACSPMLAGERSGWHSMRQQTWYGIDARRGPWALGDDVATAWADYALSAPLMLVPGGADDCRAVTQRIPFRSWLDGTAPISRRPTLADVDYHLTTLFPPVRLRGYAEIRCLDAVPDRWWPALAAITATLVDDPIAADRAAEACEPVADSWHAAARDGLADPALHSAASTCLALAAERCPAELRAEVADYAELVAAGRTPGDAVAERIAATDPTTALLEYARD